ncbi:MAG: metal-dependent hydrolase [Magnetovibrionaceae bacterium]
MDSVTQFALGSVVATSVLGRRFNPRWCVLAGGLLGTLPDLDTFIPFDNVVDNFVLHRGWTHSLLVHAVATPVLVEAALAVKAGLRAHRALIYAAVFLCLTTHAILDSFTVYGTQLFWPIWPEPLGTGTLFIIDPLYTVWLLVALLGALFFKAWAPAMTRLMVVGLGISTAYLGWAFTAQAIVSDRAERVFAERGFPTDDLLVIPAPFQTGYWRAIGVNRADYANLYLPVFGASSDAPLYRYPRLAEGTACSEPPEARRIRDFADGFVRTFWQGDDLVIADLRMGLTPSYVFRFKVGRRDGAGWIETEPSRVGQRQTHEGDWSWLAAGFRGESRVRPVEEAHRLMPAETAGATREAMGDLPLC